MKSFASRTLSINLLNFLLAAVAPAGTISGLVINRTTGKPEPNVVLDLLSPTQGMSELATATSDTGGHFSVTKDSIGMAPILIRATFHDVSFNTFAPPGRPSIEVEVYDISKDPKTIAVSSHIVIFQPQGDKLIGAEEYEVTNASQPPVAYFRTEGNFDFAIPENATFGQVSTTASMGMSVAQASIEKGKGRFAIAYAFRPGQTNIRLSYELPYANNSAALKLPATYAGAKLLVVVPPGISVTGDGLSSAGQEQGMMVFTHDPLAAKGVLAINLAGVGAAPATDGGGQSPGGGGQEGNSRTGGQEVTSAPSRLDDYKWFLFAGLAALFAMGAILLSRKRVVAVDSDAGPPEGPAAKATKPGKTQKKAAGPAPAAARPVAPAGPPANVAAVVDQHVSVSMDSLKDQIFRLELRKQAGTISEEDYAREKGKVEKLLRDLVQG
jgi:hypothetical protein